MFGLTISSWHYLLGFLPAVYVIYAACPQSLRWIVLLGSSYAFCWFASHLLPVYLLAATVITWATALLIDRARSRGAAHKRPGETRAERKQRRAVTDRHMRIILLVGIMLNLGMLVVLKYGVFIEKSLYTALGVMGLQIPSSPSSHIALPLGISFYTLQAISYVVDVYRGKYPVCHNLGTVALFLAFFPQLTEGPIGRFEHLAPQLRAGTIAVDEKRAYGIQLILWGCIKKLVVADRLEPLVSALFDQPTRYSGIMIALAALLYTLQLYADFSGVIDIARGSAELVGVSLEANFRQPFFSRSVNEFWRRWHMTLGGWLRDYVFYPVSLSRQSRWLATWARTHLTGRATQLLPATLALAAVWLATGIWHGAAWKYVAYGLYYFGLVMIGMLLEPAIARFFSWSGINRAGKGTRAVALLRTFCMVVLGMMLFRAASLRDFATMFYSFLSSSGLDQLTSGELLKHGVDSYDLLIVALVALAMLIIDIAHEHDIALRPLLLGKSRARRWATGLALFVMVVVFGAYGALYTPVPSIYAHF